MRLTEADEAAQLSLLKQYASLMDVELAWALKALYDQRESSDTAYAAKAAYAVSALAAVADTTEIHALACWTRGMAAVDAGHMETAIAYINEAEAVFTMLNQPHAAASTQVSKLIALAILGRYDEAIECGLQTREVFLALGDLLTVGKIEQNLGGIHFRRDNYREAEEFYRTARERFATLNALQDLTKAENNLATVLTAQHKFRQAAPLYQLALTHAQHEGFAVTQAEIECNLGCLKLFQGRFDQALDYLERSRRRYAVLGMPHEAAVAEQELADAYLELNLAPEAAAIYARVIPIFAERGMRAEQARALAYAGRACLLLNQRDAARVHLNEARALYAVEGNVVGAALVTLTEADVYYAEGDFNAAHEAALRAEQAFRTAGAKGRMLLARWLQGETARALHWTQQAHTILLNTLQEAEMQVVPQLVQRCLTTLGLLYKAEGDVATAEMSFKQAVSVIESLRAPLPADEFRTAFIADKLTPYAELVRLCLAEGTPERVAEAFSYVERARARALVEMVSGALPPHPRPRDAFEAEVFARLEALQEDLNWFYSQINRARDGSAERRTVAIAALQNEVGEREARVLELTRQLQQRGQSVVISVEPPTIAQLQHHLGTDTVLVEYFSLDDELLVFIISNEGIAVVRQLGTWAVVEAALTQLRYQIDVLRHGAEHVHSHLHQLTERAQHHLRTLYDLLVRPIESHIGDRRVLVVPHRVLHYVPFHALYDGARYLIEQHEVAYMPSAGILPYCLGQPSHELQRAVFLGVPDTHTPRVRDEVLALAPLFPEAETLLGAAATLTALRAHASSADILHLACHGHFRPDNPLFSSLRLADGWLTVRETYDLELSCKLVVLSACETGVSAIAPGDELIGLARGFFSAGAPSLLVSLWTVDDAATEMFMVAFYTRLRSGVTPATALREAQCALLHLYPHPFFWSPFVLLGRWT